jgi:hypothetical protein
MVGNDKRALRRPSLTHDSAGIFQLRCRLPVIYPRLNELASPNRLSSPDAEEFPNRNIGPSSLSGTSSLEIEDFDQIEIMDKDIAKFHA